MQTHEDNADDTSHRLDKMDMPIKVTYSRSDRRKYNKLHPPPEDTWKFESLDFESMLCTICTGVMKVAVRTSCGHLFCSSCLTMWYSRQHSATCPMCRSVQTHEAVRDVALQKAVNKLMMTCPLCSRTMPRRQASSHQAICRYRCEDEEVSSSGVARKQVVGAHNSGGGIAVERRPSCLCMLCQSSISGLYTIQDLPEGLDTFVVVSRPRGSDFFFVRSFEGSYPFTNVFIHKKTFTEIIQAARVYYKCKDNVSPILMPRVGECIVGVLSTIRSPHIALDSSVNLFLE